jgi:hypothetical protein
VLQLRVGHPLVEPPLRRAGRVRSCNRAQHHRLQGQSPSPLNHSRQSLHPTQPTLPCGDTPTGWSQPPNAPSHYPTMPVYALDDATRRDASRAGLPSTIPKWCKRGAKDRSFATRGSPCGCGVAPSRPPPPAVQNPHPFVAEGSTEECPYSASVHSIVTCDPSPSAHA